MRTVLKYVPKHLKEVYERAGWIVKDKLRGTPHGEWSYIGEWAGKGEPVFPEMEAIQKD